LVGLTCHNAPPMMRPPESAPAFGQQATILPEEVPSLLGGSWVSPPPARIPETPGFGSVCFRPNLGAAPMGYPARSAEPSLRIPPRSAPLKVRSDFGGTPPNSPRAWAAPPRPLPVCAEIQDGAPSLIRQRRLDDGLKSATSGLKPPAASRLKPTASGSGPPDPGSGASVTVRGRC
jgi:hypothetical protein